MLTPSPTAPQARSLTASPGRFSSPPLGEPWLTAAIHMDNPYCSCKLRRVRSSRLSAMCRAPAPLALQPPSLLRSLHLTPSLQRADDEDKDAADADADAAAMDEVGEAGGEDDELVGVGESEEEDAPAAAVDIFDQTYDMTPDKDLLRIKHGEPPAARPAA